jgi:hypothetical protein
MRIALDVNRMVSALEEMPSFTMLAIEPLSKIAVQPLHPNGKIRLRRPDYEVVVRGHQAERKT